jgi:hypothetical protein
MGFLKFVAFPLSRLLRQTGENLRQQSLKSKDEESIEIGSDRS